MSFFKETNYNGGQQTNSNAKTFKPFYSIKDNTDNTYRIAPSCRNLPQGEYSVYRKIHFGYGIQDTNNPDKFRHRPFECIQRINYKTKMVEVSCPECAKIENVKREMEALKVELTNAGHPRDYINQALTPQTEWLSQHNLDGKSYCYAKNLSGEWNVLKIGYRVKQALDELMKRMSSEEGIKALDPATGVWLKFVKNGLKGSKALTTVEVLTERVEMNGQMVKITKSAPLTDIDVAAIEALPDVTNNTIRLNYEQINALVESGGDPAVAATVFALGEKREASPVRAAPVQQSRPVAQVASNPVSPAMPVAQTVKAATPQPNTESMALTPDEFLRRFSTK